MSKIKIEFGFGIEFRSDGSGILGHEQRRGLIAIGHKAFELFGGYTKSYTVGAWRDPDTNKVVTEAGCTIFVFINTVETDGFREIDLMVQEIKDSLQQKAVAVTRTEVQFDIL